MTLINSLHPIIEIQRQELQAFARLVMLCSVIGIALSGCVNTEYCIDRDGDGFGSGSTCKTKLSSLKKRSKLGEVIESGGSIYVRNSLDCNDWTQYLTTTCPSGNARSHAFYGALFATLKKNDYTTTRKEYVEYEKSGPRQIQSERVPVIARSISKIKRSLENFDEETKEYSFNGPAKITRKNFCAPDPRLCTPNSSVLDSNEGTTKVALAVEDALYLGIASTLASSEFNSKQACKRGNTGIDSNGFGPGQQSGTAIIAGIAGALDSMAGNASLDATSQACSSDQASTSDIERLGGLAASIGMYAFGGGAKGPDIGGGIQAYRDAAETSEKTAEGFDVALGLMGIGVPAAGGIPVSGGKPLLTKPGVAYAGAVAGALHFGSKLEKQRAQDWRETADDAEELVDLYEEQEGLNDNLKKNEESLTNKREDYDEKNCANQSSQECQQLADDIKALEDEISDDLEKKEKVDAEIKEKEEENPDAKKLAEEEKEKREKEKKTEEEKKKKKGGGTMCPADQDSCCDYANSKMCQEYLKQQNKKLRERWITAWIQPGAVRPDPEKTDDLVDDLVPDDLNPLIDPTGTEDPAVLKIDECIDPYVQTGFIPPDQLPSFNLCMGNALDAMGLGTGNNSCLNALSNGMFGSIINASLGEMSCK